MTYDDMIGKKIEACYINTSRDTMMWKVDGKWYRIDAYGDCCSTSWFEHCDNVDALVGGTLVSVENVGGYSSETDDGYGEIKVDMIKFTTDKGYSTLEFRNESNGYYSGWCQIGDGDGFDVTDSTFKVMVDM